MAANRRGNGLAILALVISLIALGLSIQTYRSVEGTRVLKDQIQALRGALDAVRKETAQGLARLEQAVQPPGGSGNPGGARR